MFSLIIGLLFVPDRPGPCSTVSAGNKTQDAAYLRAGGSDEGVEEAVAAGRFVQVAGRSLCTMCAH